MSSFFYNVLQGSLPLPMIAYVLAYLLPLRKRPHWLLRCLGCVLFSMFASPFITTIFDILGAVSVTNSLQEYYSIVFWYMVTWFGLMILQFWLCADVSLTDAIYGTTCAYVTQHLADALIRLIFPSNIFIFPSIEMSTYYLCAFLISLVILMLCAFLVARPLPEHGAYNVGAVHSWLSALLVLLFVIGLNYTAKIVQNTNSTSMFRICMLFDILCCVFVLWVQVERQQEKRLTREMQVERVIRERQKEQYETARDSVERINAKCHELKHRVAAIRSLTDPVQVSEELERLEQEVVFYDYMVKSGNEVIDTVLTEKELLCEQAGITWTCMANGPALDFMEAGDLYLLFNSALDNAIESVKKLDDPKQRIIALTLHRKRDMALLQIENYYNKPLEFHDGLPISTKTSDDSHGYGLKNIRNVVKKYHGILDITAENGLFLFSLLLPLPPAQE